MDQLEGAQEARHEDIIRLASFTECQALENTITGEQHKLPQGTHWTLGFQNGFAFIGGLGQQTVWASSKLNRSVWQKDGQLHVLTKFSDASGRSLSKLELLADLQSDRAAGYAAWQCAEGLHTCKVYTLALPRAGFHRFWELQGIHSGMHLTTSGKQGAAWQTKGIGRWTKVLEKHGLSGASFLLSHTSAASRGEAHVTVHSHAMSTAAVLCLHLHWGHRLKDEGDRQAALRQLEAILSARLADNTIIKVSRSLMSAHCSGFSEDMDMIVASGKLFCQNALARKAILQHTAMPEGWAEPVAAVPFLCRLWRASSNAMWHSCGS